MLVTPEPIVTLVKLEHQLNAYSPMLVTLSGITTLVRIKQWKKELAPTLVTGLPLIDAGMVTSPSVPVYPVMVMFVPLSRYVKSPDCPAVTDTATKNMPKTSNFFRMKQLEFFRDSLLSILASLLVYADRL